jgi:hypothetical protein
MSGVHDTITFAQVLSGSLTTIGPGLADLELTADGATPLGNHTRVAAQLSFVTEHRFRAQGTVTVASRLALACTTAEDGHLAAATEDGVRGGTAVLDAIGRGPLARAHGRIRSSFVVSGDGRVTDEQVLVLHRRQDHEQGVGGAPRPVDAGGAHGAEPSHGRRNG